MAVKFDWDENKNRANIAKHVSSSQQQSPCSMILFSLPVSIRFQTKNASAQIGAALNGILFVVHTIKELSGGDELYWIISARYATSAERKAYEEDSY